MYIEQYSNDPAKYEQDAQQALAPIIKVRARKRKGYLRTHMIENAQSRG